jgi:ribonuclease H / adenosylcobalamin/alpha-ribazole phosphatase
MTITTIFLVRHGRTGLNAQGRFRGRHNPPLDDRGFAEASEAAGRLGGAGVRAVYTSPLLRSVQTAEVIARTCRVVAATEQGLIDLDHGVWTGVTAEEAGHAQPEAFSRFREAPRQASIPGGESMPGVERRIFQTLTRIAERHSGESVAAVSHEIPIRLVIASLAGIEGRTFWGVDLPTGSIIELTFKDAELSLASETRMQAVP